MTTRIEPARYELTGRLGKGGMGVVYSAQKHLYANEEMPVAVKVMHRKYASQGDDGRAGESEQALRLFQREGKESLRVNHGHLNLVTVFDYGVSDKGYAYLIMELVDGVNLRALVPPFGEEAGQLPFPVVRRIAFDVLLALEHLHEHGKIHRDVKTENILLARSGVVKLTDLGLVKNANRPGSGCFRGTPEYASPEALMDRPLTACSDLYSLGVVLYELTTRTLMNGEGNADALVYAMEKHKPEPLPEDTPEDLRALIQAFTIFQPAMRGFQTASDALAFLEAQDEPIADNAEMTRLVAKRASKRASTQPGPLPSLGWPFEEREMSRRGWVQWLPWILMPVAFLIGVAVVGPWVSDGTSRLRVDSRAEEEPVPPVTDAVPDEPIANANEDQSDNSTEPVMGASADDDQSPHDAMRRVPPATNRRTRPSQADSTSLPNMATSTGECTGVGHCYTAPLPTHPAQVEDHDATQNGTVTPEL